MVSTTYTVSGMTCAHCVASVREEVEEIPGVRDVAVTLDTGALTVSGEQEIGRDAVAAAVAEAGYRLV